MAKQAPWAKRLAERQARVGLTDAEMSARTGIQVRTYNNYRNGQREPEFEMFLVLCRVLGVTPNDLLLEDAASPPLPHEIELLDMYRRLSTENRAIFDNIIKNFLPKSAQPGEPPVDLRTPSRAPPDPPAIRRRRA